MTTKIETKYGTAHLTENGHYQIKTHEKGHYGEYLHRLVFEDFYKITLSPEIVIHHDDGNPQNNEIWNLIPLTKAEHTALHSRGNTWSRGKIVADETRANMSKAHKGKTISQSQRINRSKADNSTGFLRVYIKPAKTTKQGFIWCYQYQEGNKRKNWTSVDLLKLKEKILLNGLEWLVIDETNAQKTCDKYGYDFKELC